MWRCGGDRVHMKNTRDKGCGWAYNSRICIPGRGIRVSTKAIALQTKASLLRVVVAEREKGESLQQATNPCVAAGEDEDYDATAVANMIANQTDIDLLRQGGHTRGSVRASRQQHFELPAVRSTPLGEFNRSQALPSLAFPSLYPRGQGEFVQALQRSTDYAEYIEQAMQWHDGRSARHERFRHVVFDTLMRQQISSPRSFFVRKQGGGASTDIKALRSLSHRYPGRARVARIHREVRQQSSRDLCLGGAEIGP